MYKFTGFTQKANDVLNAAIEYAENMGHTYIGSEHLLLGLLTQNGGIAYTVLINKKLTAGKVEDAVRNSIGFGVPTVLTPGDFTPRCKNIIESAMIQARDMGHNYVGTEHLLIAMIKEGSSAATAVMTRLGVSPQEILQELLKAFGSASGKDSGKPETVKKPGGRTDTPTLNQYGRDLTSFAAAGRIDPVIGRQKEIERVIQILSRRTKNNPCLIGEPGVGKTAIAEGLALKIATGEAGGPYTVTLSDGEPLVLDNVLVGEVWVCSGQSNMEMPVSGFMFQPVEGAVDAIADAGMYPGIRMFTVPRVSSKTPLDDCDAAWQTATPASVGQ